jgi:hypothetical protein
MNETLAGVNMIAPELVELACYSAWYPAFVGLRRYEFEMQADVPEGFLTTTNGEESGRRTSGGRVVTQWKSFQPGFDIVLLASSRLKGTAGGRPDARVEIYSDRLPRELLKSKTDGLAEAMRALSGRYGAPRLKGNLRLVYSPRAGWGYSRIPLVVVSEERAVRIVGEENGEARDFRDNAHELAHFWWMVADPSKPDDWINEGGAEFSAFRVSKARFGASFAETLLAGYRKNVRRSKTASAIAETETASPDREVNRYDKPALILLEAQRRYGEDALDGVLKAVHVRFAGSGEATTVVFLAEVRSQLGEEAEAYFREELYRRVPPPS